MQKAERVSSSEDVSLNRRDLLKRAGMLATLPLFGSTVTHLEGQAERDREFNQSFFGFRGLSPLEFYELVQNFNDSNSVIQTAEISDISSPTEIPFSLREDESSVIVTLSGSSSSPVTARPLLVKNGNDKTYLAPIIHGREEHPTLFSGINIGKHGKGEHTLLIEQDDSSSLPLDKPLTLSVSVPDKHALFTKFIEQTPVLKIKNPDEVMDDMPIFTFSKILKKDDIYQVVTMVMFSSENGGTKPPDLLTRFGRTYDIEWVMQQLFSVQGDIVPGMRRYQTIDHGSDRFNGSFIDKQPVVTTATANNNFADSDNEILRIGNRTMKNPLERVMDIFVDSDKEESIYYSPQPIFVSDSSSGAELLSLYPQLQEWSMYEVALENCVNLSDGNNETIKSFIDDLKRIQGYYTTKFPDRGCGPNKIDLLAITNTP